VLALLTLLAVAGPVPLDSDSSFVEGRRHYESVELEDAVARFTEALTREYSPEDEARLWAWIGLSHGQLGRLDSARAAFKKAVSLAPEIQLPAPAPPAVAEILEEERAAAAPAEPEPEPEPEDTTPPEPEPEPAAMPPWNVMAGGAAAGVGGLTFLVAGVLTGVALDTGYRQAGEAEFNDEANALVDLMYLELGIAGALGAVGAVGVGAGVALFLIPVEE
jgi:tetratricopeptide (TPR) repeat protein